MTVTGLLATGLTDPVRKRCTAYAVAAAKAVPTAEVDTIYDLDKARRSASALLKLEPALTQGVCHTCCARATTGVTPSIG